MRLTRLDLAEMRRRPPQGTLYRAAPNPARTWLTLDIALAIRSIQSLGHRSWKPEAAYRKRWREKTRAVGEIAMMEGGWAHAPTVPKRVLFAAFVRNLLDDDNLRGALKGCRDGLKDAGLIDNDAPSSGHIFGYGQQIDRTRVGVLVWIELLPAGAPDAR